MGVGSGEQGGSVAPMDFIRGTNIVDKGLIVLFFGLFPVASPPLEEDLIVLFFGIFLVLFGLFPLAPPGNFSADALA